MPEEETKSELPAHLKNQNLTLAQMSFKSCNEDEMPERNEESFLDFSECHNAISDSDLEKLKVDLDKSSPRFHDASQDLVAVSRGKEGQEKQDGDGFLEEFIDFKRKD